MDLQAYREQKQTGVESQPEPVETQVPDAGVQTNVDPSIEPDDSEFLQDEDEQPGDQETATEPSNELDDVQVPEKEQSAFYKRLEREKAKLKEQLEQEIQQQYNPYKQFFDQLGVDPNEAGKKLQEYREKQQAMAIAQQNGWNEQQTTAYLQQQKERRELQELKVTVQIHELSDNPEYAGIKSMKPQITEMMSVNPALTVEQAYWAIGGPSRAAQLKREAEQREIAKRSQSKRTVQSDSQPVASNEKPLSADIIEQARKLGMTEAEARKLMQSTPGNLDEYRAMKKQKKA